MNARKRRYAPKKRPKQARSRVTVDSIVEAAARIMSESGPERLNTNRIAQRAGVAVASVYQYFPNKDSIVNTLLEKELADELAEFTARSAELEGRPLGDVVRVAIRSVIDVHAKRPGLVRSMLQSAVRLGTADAHAGARQAVIDLVVETMRSRQDELRSPTHLEVKGFLVVHAVEATIHAAALERPAFLADPAFAEQLVELVERFLLDVRPEMRLRRRARPLRR